MPFDLIPRRWLLPILRRDHQCQHIAGNTISVVIGLLLASVARWIATHITSRKGAIAGERVFPPP
jgi:hypothetical protein